MHIDISLLTYRMLFFGSFFSFILAVAQIVREKPQLANYGTSAVFLCNSIIQLGILLILSDIPVRYPWTIFTFLSAVFFLGPLMYFYSYTLIHPLSVQEGIPGSFLLHLVPGTAVFITEIIFQSQPEDFRQAVIRTALVSTEWTAITFLSFAGAIHIVFYFIYMLIQGFSIRDVKSVQVPARILFGVYFFCIISIILVFYGFLTRSDDLLGAGGSMVAFINVLIFLINSRYPRFFRLIESEIQKKKYERSLLFGIDTALMSERLHALMINECIYRECDLSLEKLSIMLQIKPHQLSQMLNERLGVNFWQYINSFRIEEAKRLLVENPEQSIITICFKVGFGSKSTFNTIFKKFTGESPSEYRNIHTH